MLIVACHTHAWPDSVSSAQPGLRSHDTKHTQVVKRCVQSKGIVAGGGAVEMEVVACVYADVHVYVCEKECG